MLGIKSDHANKRGPWGVKKHTMPTLTYLDEMEMDLHMMTSSNEKKSALLAHCAGNSPVTGEFPIQRPMTRSFDIFFDLCLNKRLSKHS